MLADFSLIMIEFFKKLLPSKGLDDKEDEPIPLRSSNSPSWLMPDRYRTKKIDETVVITCLESPNIAMKIQKGKVVNSVAARKSPERTIYLDGAAAGEPFMDHDRQIYNLDHHEGVERSFTLSTCEQSMVMVRRGINLKEKNWTIYANEPDLDTLLAIWILLNHIHLTAERSHVFAEIMPLVRLEGIIDALGLEHTDLLAFPADLLERTKKRLEKLREDEIKIKKEGQWNDLDYTSYTYSMLKKIDNIIFRVQDFRNFKGVVEISRADLTETDAAVIYHCDMGIYELEEYLAKLYGKKPTFILLQKDRHNYTIRKSELFSPLQLEKIYERLNLFDPAVSGRDPENRWGGSTDIGGSPRNSGTELTAVRIVRIAREAFQETDSISKLKLFGRALAYGVLPQLLGWATLIAGLFFSPFEKFLSNQALGLTTGFFTFIMIFGVVVFYLGEVRLNPSSYGFRIPVGWDWLKVLPASLVFGLFGALWLPSDGAGTTANWFGASLLLPLFSSLFYFACIHGNLIPHFQIQRFRGPFFISLPTLYVAVAFAIGSALLPIRTISWLEYWQFHLPPLLHFLQNSTFVWALTIPINFIYGLSLGLIRERTESFLPVLAIHTLLTIIVYWFA